MRLGLTFLLAVLWLTACQDSNFDEASARQRILELEQLQRQVHFEADAATFAGLLSEPHLSVNRGTIQETRRAENQERFQGYFDSVHFVEWDDLAEPVIRFSADGSLAYSVVHRRVTVQYPTEQGLYHGTTDFAWTAIYRRTATDWEIESVTSTNKESESRYLRNIVAFANCQSPEGAYTTELLADHNSFLEFRQTYSYRDGGFTGQVIGDSLGQSLTSARAVEAPLGPEAISMLQGHNFFWMYLQPDQFFNQLTATDAWHWEGQDALGNPVELVRDTTDYQVRQIYLQNPMDTTELIEIHYLNFDATAYGPLPAELLVVQAQRDTFTFDFREVSFNVADFPAWEE